MSDKEEFDWEVYRVLNLDLHRSIKYRGDYIKHYFAFGKKQNRPSNIYQVYSDFDAEQYKKNYDELKELSKKELEKHWIFKGRNNGYIYNSMEKLEYINGIDIIYWINLESSIERRENMNSLLKRIQIKNEKILAIDGKNVGDVFGRFISTKKNIDREKSCLVYACLLSHLETIKTFHSSDNNIALILEDDITLEYMKYWKSEIKKVIEEAPKDWEVISLSQTLMYNERLTEIYTKYWDNCFSAMSYIINRKGAQKIMNLWDKKENEWKFEEDYHTTERIIFSNTNMYVYKFPYFTYSNKNVSIIHPFHKDAHMYSKKKILEYFI